MKKLALIGLVMLSFAACIKTEDYPEDNEILVSMNFVQVNTPPSAQAGDTVRANVRITGSNSCTVFKGFNGNTSATDQYDIRAIGAVPNPNLGANPGCTDMIISKDTFLTITPKAPGKLVFRYFNNETLYRADTVVVTQ